jgi:hypothetical protein
MAGGYRAAEAGHGALAADDPGRPGDLRPWWTGPLEFLIGVAWAMILIIPGWILNYGLLATFLTPLVVLLIDPLHPVGWSLALDPLIDTLLGCAIALVIGFAPGRGPGGHTCPTSSPGP